MSARSSPWDWYPRSSGWYARMQALSQYWEPGEEFAEIVPGIRQAVGSACDQEASWLLHPATAPLFTERPTPHGNLQFVLWTAANTPAVSGSIHLSSPLWAWAPDGGSLVDAGEHDLRTLAEKIHPLVGNRSVALDVWGDSIGYPYEWLYPKEWGWAAAQPLAPDDEAVLKSQIVAFMRAFSGLTTHHPQCARWIANMTRVVIPLRRSRDGRFKSGSVAQVPSLIYCDLDGGDYQILESIVHETSHQYLCFAEAGTPFVVEGHDDRYSSPLRPEPRPLRGIFLAYHALAFMCAYYADESRVILDDSVQRELSTLRSKCADAERTLVEHSRFLTPAGQEFLHETKQVAAYGS